MRQGFFITLEGPDGAGKSTLARSLSSCLTSAGHKVTLTREPGGCPISEKIRELLLDPNNTSMCDKAELLLFAAARAQHLYETVIPSLDAGHIVICDRFNLSTIAYQGHGRGLDMDLISTLDTIAVGHDGPDLILMVDLDEVVSAERMEAMGKSRDRIEAVGGGFATAVRKGFLSEAYRRPNARVIDGSKPTGEVLSDALSIVNAFMNAR